MKKIIFLAVICLMPVCSWAEYTIYLKNGSVISDVPSYSESAEGISIYFQTGAMLIPRNEVLRITGEETPEPAAPEVSQDTDDRQVSRENAETQPAEDSQKASVKSGQRPAGSGISSGKAAEDSNADMATVRSELDSVYSEIRSVESDEARLVKEINEKRSRPVYNKYQAIQVQQETEPLQQELLGIQQKKEELRQQKIELEDELRSVQ